MSAAFLITHLQKKLLIYTSTNDIYIGTLEGYDHSLNVILGEVTVYKGSRGTEATAEGQASGRKRQRDGDAVAADQPKQMVGVRQEGTLILRGEHVVMVGELKDDEVPASLPAGEGSRPLHMRIL
jgi:small nuclear ribonucleoprotein (snRNP)-like protein